MEQGKTFMEGLQAAIPTSLGYISIGLACGIIAAPYMNPFEMLLMSLLVYAGSAQFAMLAMFAVQAPLIDITLTVFLINLRLGLLSLHASTIFREESIWQNVGIGSLLTDETYGVLMGERLHQDYISPAWMNGNNLNSYIAWALGTVIGTTLGSLLPNPEAFGLDFALLGMFVGIFASQFYAMLHRIKLQKILLILAVVGASFLLLTMIVSDSLAVLIATLIGCTVGVMVND